MTTIKSAAELLANRLDAAARRGETWPCKDRDEWTSEDADARAAAALACLPCPVSALCSATADHAREKFGVWGGRDFTPRRKPWRGGAA